MQHLAAIFESAALGTRIPPVFLAGAADVYSGSNPDARRDVIIDGKIVAERMGLWMIQNAPASTDVFDELLLQAPSAGFTWEGLRGNAAMQARAHVVLMSFFLSVVDSLDSDLADEQPLDALMLAAFAYEAGEPTMRKFFRGTWNATIAAVEAGGLSWQRTAANLASRTGRRTLQLVAEGAPVAVAAAEEGGGGGILVLLLGAGAALLL